MSVLGVDLSLTGTGLCWLADDPIDSSGVDLIETKGKKGDSFDKRFHRLGRIRASVCDVGYGAQLAVIEGPSYGSAATGSSFFDRAGLFWIVYDYFRDIGVQVAICPPTVRAKYATGKGNASKDQVLVAAAKRYHWFDIDNNNVADATVMAAMGARHLMAPIDGDLPKACLDAMDGVEWP